MSLIKKIKVITKEWEDFLILDIQTSSLYRENKIKDTATFSFYKNIIYVEWLFWDEEIFAEHNGIYYKVNKINFKTIEWEDVCFIDEQNKIIYRKNENNIGHYKYLQDDSIEVIWSEAKLKNKLDILNIKTIKNSLTPFKQIKSIENTKIPNIIHFIYGFKLQTNEFELYKYLAIKSAINVNNPIKTYFYYKYKPYGPYWDKIKNELTLVHMNPPTEIFGNPLTHYAHQADVIRLQKLSEIGGIYLDIDTICLKSFKPLLNHDFVIGIQGNKDNTKLYGLCNAVILSKPKSNFILKWIDSYTTFRSTGRDEYWDEHSVLTPLKLAYNYKDEIILMENNTFYNPLWHNIDEILFNEDYKLNEYKKIINHNFCIHLWDTYSSQYLSQLKESDILTKNTLYNIFSRKFIQNKISICFLTFNRYDKTVQCLNSYLKCLDYDYILELIIFDNHSDHDLILFLKEFELKHNKIKIIFNEENVGVCNGRIKLFNEVKGDIICSLDSDAQLLDDSFFNYVTQLLYDESFGIVGISGAYLKSWKFGEQEDIDEKDEHEYYCHHIAGCCQIFRKDLFIFGFKLDPYYGFFWCEDTDLSMQSLLLNKINYKINGKSFIHHQWGGSGKNYHDLFLKNWEYFKNKWQNKVLTHVI